MVSASTVAADPARAALPGVVTGLLETGAATGLDAPRLLETHISWVVLVGSYAYKVKKPVDFGFLDFSTVERRAAACADEVRLNRRLCPDVYLGVVELAERNGASAADPPERPGEPAVWMRRLPADGMLPALIERGAVPESLMRRIARRLARFHAVAATGPSVDEHGGPAAVRANWDENFAQTASLPADVLRPAVRDGIVGYVGRFLGERAALLERRVAAGRVRDGHGDLHAANICVERRRVQLFDCLEFAPRYRRGDVASEVAFLVMDLDHHGRADLATTFLDAYVRASGDAEILELRDFYTCYRAFVRGKVLGLRLDEPDLPRERRAAIADEVRAYFDLASAYAGALARPTLVVTMGPPASGKTTLARALARRLGLVHLSSDVVRKELAGLQPTERRSEVFGRGLYDAQMTRRTYAALRRRAARWLRRDRSVVLDGTFGQAAERAAVRALASRAGARLVVLLCRADEPTLWRRLAARAGESTASDARLEIWPALRAAFSQPTELAEAVALDATAPLAELVERALAVVRERPRGVYPERAPIHSARVSG